MTLKRMKNPLNLSVANLGVVSLFMVIWIWRWFINHFRVFSFSTLVHANTSHTFQPLLNRIFPVHSSPCFHLIHFPLNGCILNGIKTYAVVLCNKYMKIFPSFKKSTLWFCCCFYEGGKLHKTETLSTTGFFFFPFQKFEWIFRIKRTETK